MVVSVWRMSRPIETGFLADGNANDATQSIGYWVDAHRIISNHAVVLIASAEIGRCILTVLRHMANCGLLMMFGIDSIARHVRVAGQ